MSTKVNYYLNNNEINPPDNAKEVAIELNFDKDKDVVQSQVSLNDWTFSNENSHTIIDYIEAGVSGGVGIFEGLPFALEIEKAGVKERPFNGYLDLTDSPKLSCMTSTVVAKEKQKIDWLNDVADGFSFEYLAHLGEITPANYVYVPYVLNSVPNYQEAALALVSVFVVGEQINAAIQHIVELTSECANPFEATAIIRAVLYVAYLTILIISLMKLIRDLINLLIQPVKYHSGMLARDLFVAGCKHLGLTFSSPEILDAAPYSKMIIIPEKYNNPADPTKNGLLGFTARSIDQTGYFKGSFGDFVRAMKTMFNGKITLTDNAELIFSRQDKNISTAQYVLPDLYQPVYSYNASEFKSNLLISFDVDFTDKNTVQEFQGTNYQVIVQPKVKNNQAYVLAKGLQMVQIPFALAKTKTELTTIEIIVKDFLDLFSIIVNGVISALNALIDVANDIIDTLNDIIDAIDFIFDIDWFDIEPISNINAVNFGTLITNRIGMMKIETDFTSRPKVLILQQENEDRFNKIDVLNQSALSGKGLYQGFYFVNSFVPSVDFPNGNQFLIKEFDKVHFCFEDYVKVKNNNRIIVQPSGAIGEIETLKWNVKAESASIRVRISTLYTNNLIETFLEPNGQ